jgi:hypothetical protein
MAQKVLVQFVDDLDGTSSDDVTTVQFGLDGVSYEIDLNADNAEQLRKNFANYLDAARRTGGRLKSGSRVGGKPARSGEAGQIREWALENGYELSGRGRIPSHVTEAYKEATASPKPSTKRRANGRKK